jgi:hypothetical protein
MNRLVSGALGLGSDGLPATARGRKLAVGTTILYGSATKDYPDLQVLAESLRRLTPLDRTATFLIYEIPGEDVMATAVNEGDMSEKCSP